jgi:hypothetical protein
MRNLKCYEEFVYAKRIKDIKTSPIANDCDEMQKIQEGGAYGHLSHPFEKNDLTFGDMKEICNLTINGLFTTDNMVAEKTDGQNLMVCWKDGRIVASRNKSHLRNKGENALSKEEIADFLGKGKPEALKQAWIDALTDLENALSHCDQGELEKMFRGGERFMSLEVICPEAEQTIPYGSSMIVFHGWKEYDINGEEISEDKVSAKTIAKLIGDANQSQQKRFLIRGPQEYDVKPFENHEERYKNYIDRINEIMSRNSTYTDETNLDDFVLSETKDFLLKEIPELKDVKWGEITLDNVAANVSGIDRSIDIRKIKKFLKPYTGVGDKVANFQQNKKFRNDILRPIISLFMDLGLDTCRNIRKFLATNPEEAARKLRKKYLDAINRIKEEGTDVGIAYMEEQLGHLTDPSALENLLPTEGITFLYKGKLYKLTGYFQVLNNICGYFKYKK